jgi:hypothetical protein
MPSIADVFDGKNPPLPKSTDALYALVSSMAVYAKEHKEEMDKIANSISYAMQLPPDFSAVLMKDYIYIEKGYKERLFQLPEFTRWLRVRGGELNGIL